MRPTEARILIFLEATPKMNHYATVMSDRLNVDYAYLLRTLNRLKLFKWIVPVKRGHKVFYDLSSKGRAELSAAKLRLERG